MSEIERLGRAYFKECWKRRLVPSPSPEPKPHELAFAIDDVRIVLTALREPSEEMMRVAERSASFVHSREDGSTIGTAEVLWRAMIDHLLTDDIDTRAGSLEQTGFA